MTVVRLSIKEMKALRGTAKHFVEQGFSWKSTPAQLIAGAQYLFDILRGNSGDAHASNMAAAAARLY
ncbi:MAG: hypothetical protein KDJ17_07280 [Hyphomicrobiaceae bacterium]|nr:hypothetical protein [Hyphomicrobiaceae bacterium]